MEELRHRIEQIGREAGLDLIGFASADPFPEVQAELARRKQEGLASSLGFTYTDPETATRPGASFPWAKTLVVGARSYLPAAGSPQTQPDHGRVARVTVEDAYSPLRAALTILAASLTGDGFLAEVLCDDNRLVDRAVAVRAGLGWWGKNTMVLAPGLGPWFVIGSVVTNAVLPLGEPSDRGCGSCSACLPACPTGALVAPGILDARRCLAAIAQAPGPIPLEFREVMGDRLYGCDDCLEACPPGHRLLTASTSNRGTIDLASLLSAADSTLLERWGHWFLPDRNPDLIRRNALNAAGNSGPTNFGRRDLARSVAQYVAHPNPVLAEQARWSLGRLSGSVARAVFQGDPSGK
jgi:epoxyqueuosine reductase